MPRLSKKIQAARLREAAKKLGRETAQALLNPPDQSVQDPEEALPLEPDITLSVKQEPMELVVNPFDATTEHLEEEIKVEPPEPVEGAPDPIGQLTDEPYEPRCQFCLKLFREVGGRAVIPRERVVFVLGVKKWGSFRARPECCKGCKKLFELFYDFKRSCLTALARPQFLLTCAEKNVSKEVVDLRSVVQTPKVEVKAPPQSDEEWEKDDKKIGQSQEDSDVDIDGFGGETSENNRNASVGDSTMTDQQDSDGFSWSMEEEEDEVNAKPAKRKRENKKSSQDKKYCFRCRKFYETLAIYMEHKPTCKKPERDPPPLACSLCPKRFTNPDKLMYHMNKHNGVRTVPCRREGCTKMFFDPNQRNQHETRCGQNIQIICTVCAAILSSTGALRAHMPIHGEPTVICEVCNKAFHTRAKLKKHSSVHSDERKHECKTCGKRFKSHEANRVHQRIHTQEKPYVCHICGMAFTYNCLLKTHLEKGHDRCELNQQEMMAAARAIETERDFY